MIYVDPYIEETMRDTTFLDLSLKLYHDLKFIVPITKDEMLESISDKVMTNEQLTNLVKALNARPSIKCLVLPNIKLNDESLEILRGCEHIRRLCMQEVESRKDAEGGSMSPGPSYAAAMFEVYQVNPPLGKDVVEALNRELQLADLDAGAPIVTQSIMAATEPLARGGCGDSDSPRSRPAILKEKL